MHVDKTQSNTSQRIAIVLETMQSIGTHTCGVWGHK